VRQRIRIPLLGGAIHGELITFTGLSDGEEHLAIILGDAFKSDGRAPLVRMHSECLTGDVFGSGKCDCGPQLAEAIRKIHAEGGILFYLRQEGRGIGLYNKLDAYALQAQGLDTYEANLRLALPADGRDYLCAAEMLAALGIGRVRLLSNNPDKAAQLRSFGVAIDETVPTGSFVSRHNHAYLAAKVAVTQHRITLPDAIEKDPGHD